MAEAAARTLREQVSARLQGLDQEEAYQLEQLLASWRLQRHLPGEAAALESLLNTLTATTALVEGTNDE